MWGHEIIEFVVSNENDSWSPGRVYLVSDYWAVSFTELAPSCILMARSQSHYDSSELGNSIPEK